MVERIDNRFWGFLWCTNSVPNRCFEPWHKFCHSWNVRQSVGARRAGYSKGSQLASSYVRDGQWYGRKSALDLTAKQIRQETSTVRDVHQIDASHHFE